VPQGFYAVPKPVRIRTGDRLTSTCEFDNDKDKPVRAGHGAQNEMCGRFFKCFFGYCLL
jgi:hypothetical protein